MSFLIGVTGGIAAGKTLVASILMEHGAKIVDADRLAHELLLKDSPILGQILREFGPEVFDESGSVDRKKLGAIVFGSQPKRKKLERIMHPLIIARAKRLIEDHRQSGARLIVLDAALLIEAGLHECVDQVWVVISSQQMDRLIRRDMLSVDDAKKRLAAQTDNEYRMKYAHAVIENSFGPERTRDRVEELLESLDVAEKGADLDGDVNG